MRYLLIALLTWILWAGPVQASDEPCPQWCNVLPSWECACPVGGMAPRVQESCYDYAIMTGEGMQMCTVCCDGSGFCTVFCI